MPNDVTMAGGSFLGQRRRIARRITLLRRGLSLGWWRPANEPIDRRVRGRSPIVHRFHSLRRWDAPPVLVIEGVRGAGKSDLVARLQFGFRRRWAWRVGREADVLLKVGTALSAPESALTKLRKLLRRESSWVRRIRTPRFLLVQAKLDRFRGRENRQTEALGNEVERALRIGGAGAQAVTGLPVAAAPVLTRSILALRRLLVHVSPSAACRWVRKNAPDLDVGVYGQREGHVQQRLERCLIDAMAADLAQVTSRALFPLDKVVLFFDAYDSIEDSAAPSWLLELAERLREEKAKVMVVVTCRRQRVWTDAIRHEEPAEYGPFRMTDRIEIHSLEGLDREERIYALAKFLVPAHLAPKLADISAGHPMSLHLLGAAYGGARPNLDQAEEELEKRHPPPPELTEEWVDEITTAVGEELIAHLRSEMLDHARAAATLRFFDRDLLAYVMEDAFRPKCFGDLTTSPLVELWQPSPLTDPSSKDTYRLRNFARLILERGDANAGLINTWHERAEQNFRERKRKRLTTAEQYTHLAGAEELFHRLARDRVSGENLLWSAFRAELEQRRFDRCEALLEIADDLHWIGDNWNAQRLMMSGRVCISLGDYELAERRLREASKHAPLEEGCGQIALSVAQSLSRCLRLQSRVGESREIARQIYEHAGEIPVMRFQAVWTGSLLDKEGGDLVRSAENAEEARGLLGQLLAEDARKKHSKSADEHGLGPLRLKPRHLDRHEADLARRSGDYVRAYEQLAKARDGERVKVEPHVQAYTTTVESHLLRLEGDLHGARSRGQKVLDHFAARPGDWRGLGQAQRAVGQAMLAGADPAEATEHFEELLAADPRIYPSGQAVARFGLGEIRRHQGDYPAARAAYMETREARVFERCYGALGLAELANMQGQHRLAADPLRLLSHDDSFQAHPVLAFWQALICARAGESVGGGVDTAADPHLLRAQKAVGQIRRRTNGNGEDRELAAWRATEAALRNGEPMPPIVLNLP